MFNILTLNKIAKCGLDQLNDNYKITDDANVDADGIILRSFKMHDMELPESLKAVARAGAGTNNIPIDKCSEKGIVVFNTPGANANAVKELVIAGMLLASRDVIGGVAWANTLTGDDVDKQVEKGKSNFAGCEIKGKTLGIIGLGAIGILVANAAYALGMEVIGYDPYLSVDSALKLSRHVKKANSPEEVYAAADYITIHVPLMDSTRNTINAETIAQMKDGVIILNFARGGLVDTEALKTALADGTITEYITDFPDGEVIELENVICIPHLGASTPESEDNCAEMAAIELKQYLEYGIIKNSVNFPNCDAPYTGKARIALLHKNVSGMVGAITNILSADALNIDNMVNKSKGAWAYTLIDLDTFGGKADKLVEELGKIEGICRVRIVQEA